MIRILKGCDFNYSEVNNQGPNVLMVWILFIFKRLNANDLPALLDRDRKYHHHSQECFSRYLFNRFQIREIV